MEEEMRPFPGGKYVTVPMPTLVKFTGKGGYEAENKRANEVLEVDHLYGIYTLAIGRSSSTVDICDVATWMPLGAFNSVMFEFLGWEFEYDVEGTYL